MEVGEKNDGARSAQGVACPKSPPLAQKPAHVNDILGKAELKRDDEGKNAFRQYPEKRKTQAITEPVFFSHQ